QPPASVTAGSGVSGVSMVGSSPISVSGVMAPPPLGSSPNADASGSFIQSALAPPTPFSNEIPAFRPKRRGGLMVGVLLGDPAIGAAAVYLWQSGVVAPEKTVATPKPAAPETPKTEAKTEPAAPEPTATEPSKAPETPSEEPSKEAAAAQKTTSKAPS